MSCSKYNDITKMIELNPIENWMKFEGDKIPSSLGLDPIIFKYLKSNTKILDAGCGFGKTIFELYHEGYKNVSGVDINENGIKFAKSKFQELGVNLDFRVNDANSLTYNNETFDFMINQAFWTTIIGKEERIKIIKEFSRVLKKDGIIYIADFGRTWNQTHYRKVYTEGIKKKLETGTFKVFNKKTGEFMYLAHHYTKHELKQLLEEGGFEKPFYYRHTIFNTQSGNKINGHVILAIKK